MLGVASSVVYLVPEKKDIPFLLISPPIGMLIVAILPLVVVALSSFKLTNSLNLTLQSLIHYFLQFLGRTQLVYLRQLIVLGAVGPTQIL